VPAGWLHRALIFQRLHCWHATGFTIVSSNSVAFGVIWLGAVLASVTYVHLASRLSMLTSTLCGNYVCRVKQSWGWLQTSGLPVHITCVNSYLTALIKEVSHLTLNDWNGGTSSELSCFGDVLLARSAWWRGVHAAPAVSIHLALAEWRCGILAL
jgi:hypothetical protein